MGKWIFKKTHSAESKWISTGKKQASVLTSYDTQHVTQKGHRYKYNIQKDKLEENIFAILGSFSS